MARQRKHEKHSTPRSGARSDIGLRLDQDGGYGTVPRPIWRSERFLKLSVDARYVLLYLRSYPADVRSTAIFRVDADDVEAAAIGVSVERWRGAVAELEAVGYIVRHNDYV